MRRAGASRGRERAARTRAGRIPAGPWDLAVVGGGPAGLMAAIAAADCGARAVVFERMDRPGLKILASGGGRCNLTNSLEPDDFLRGLGRNGRFARDAVRGFGPNDLRRFLADNGVPTAPDAGGLVFPRSDRAGDVLDALLRSCRARGVPIVTRTEALAPRVRGGRIEGFSTAAGDVRVDCVILAAGGRGYPRLGGGDAGYRFAAESGHTVVATTPANVPLLTGEAWPRTLAGVSPAGVELRVIVDGRERAVGSGPMLFTHRGISGPAVLDVSGAAAAALAEGRQVSVTIDMAPGASRTHVIDAIEAWRRDRGRQPVAALARELVPASLAGALLDLAGIGSETPVSRLTRRDAAALGSVLRACPLSITGTEGFDRAMATRGGVSLKEVDPKTMASRVVAGLFLAGEVLDIDGPCGGFNMQWAFSSGRLAGAGAAAFGQARAVRRRGLCASSPVARGKDRSRPSGDVEHARRSDHNASKETAHGHPKRSTARRGRRSVQRP